MKKIISFIICITLYISAYCQFQNNPTQGSININNHFAGAVTGDRGVLMGTQVDTAAWNALPYVKTVPFIMVNTSSDGKTWRRNKTADKWEALVFGVISAWGLSGNSGTTTGTNFIGTTDDVDFQMRRNNLLGAWLDYNPVIGLAEFNAYSVSSIYAYHQALQIQSGISPTTRYTNFNPLRLTAARQLDIPDSSGTIALLSNIPATPNWQSVMNAGNETTTDLLLTSPYPSRNSITWTSDAGSNYGQLTYAGNSGNYMWTLPNATGTIALTSGIPTVSGTTNYVSKFTSSTSLGNSLLYDNGTNVGIGTASPTYKLHLPQLSNTANQANIAGTIFGSDGNGTTLTPTNAFTIYGQNSVGWIYAPVVLGSGRWSFNTFNSGSNINVNGNVSVGNGYTGTAAPTNGMIVEGNVGIGTTSPGAGDKFSVIRDIAGTETGDRITAGYYGMTNAVGDTNDYMFPIYTEAIITGGKSNYEIAGVSSIVNQSGGTSLVNEGYGTVNTFSGGTVNEVRGMNSLATISASGATNVIGGRYNITQTAGTIGGDLKLRSSSLSQSASTTVSGVTAGLYNEMTIAGSNTGGIKGSYHNIGVSAGTNGAIYGSQIITNLSGGTNASVRGLDVELNVSGGTVGAGYGLHVKGPNGISSDPTVALLESRMASSYGVYIRGASGQTQDLLNVVNNGYTEMFTVTAGGKVGISAASPDSTLHVVGGLKFVTGRQGSGKVLTSTATGGADWGTIPAPSLTATYIMYGDGSNLGTGSADHVIDVSGGAGAAKVGINTSTPSVALHVVGDYLLYKTTTSISTNADAVIIGDVNNIDAGLLFSVNNTAQNASLDNTGHTTMFGINTASPTSSLHVQGSVATAIVTKTANYTLTATDYTILVDATGGAVTLTLPSAAGCAGRIYVVKVIDNSANGVTISSADNIDGADSYGMTAQYKYVQIQCDGTTWNVIGNN